MRNIYIIIFALMTSHAALAQQEIILTKYTFNSLFFNPAYAGSQGEGEGSAIAHYRNQWLGFEGAPVTMMAGAEFSLADNRVGLGLNIAKENIGVESRFDAVLNYAYRIELQRGQLAAGIRTGYSQFSDNFSKAKAYDSGDIFDTPNHNYGLFHVGGGLYYNTDDFYLGLAVPSAVVFAQTNKGYGQKSRHFYLHTGFLTGDEYSDLRLEPSLLMKFEKAAPLQITLGMIGWIKEKVGVGLHWRNKDAVALSAELKFAENYHIGAAYDFTISDIRKYSDNTIEFFIGYDFNTAPKRKRVRNIRHGGRF